MGKKGVMEPVDILTMMGGTSTFTCDEVIQDLAQTAHESKPAELRSYLVICANVSILL